MTNKTSRRWYWFQTALRFPSSNPQVSCMSFMPRGLCKQRKNTVEGGTAKRCKSPTESPRWHMREILETLQRRFCWTSSATMLVQIVTSPVYQIWICLKISGVLGLVASATTMLRPSLSRSCDVCSRCFLSRLSSTELSASLNAFFQQLGKTTDDIPFTNIWRWTPPFAVLTGDADTCCFLSWG